MKNFQKKYIIYIESKEKNKKNFSLKINKLKLEARTAECARKRYTMENSKVTRREVLTSIVEGTIAPEAIVEFAKSEIAKIDAENAKRREKNAQKRAEYQPIFDKITGEILADGETKLCSEIAAELELSVQKTNSLLGMLVEAGTLVRGEKKVPKKGVQKTYTLA